MVVSLSGAPIFKRMSHVLQDFQNISQRKKKQELYILLYIAKCFLKTQILNSRERKEQQQCTGVCPNTEIDEAHCLIQCGRHSENQISRHNPALSTKPDGYHQLPAEHVILHLGPLL